MLRLRILLLSAIYAKSALLLRRDTLCRAKAMTRRSAAFLKTAGQHGAAFLLLLALSALFYAPPINATGFRYAGIGADPLGFIWFLNWWPFAWQHHLPLFTTHYAYYPVGRDMVWRTSVPALSLLTAPLIAAYGALAAYNILMLTAPGLAGWAAYLAAFELSGNFAAALTAGLIFAFCPYELGQMLGHINLAFTAAVPLSVFVVLRAVRHRWHFVKSGLVLGVLLAFEFGVSQEICTSLILFGGGGLALLFAAAAPYRAALRHLLPGLALAMAICLMLIAPFLWQMLLHYQAARQNFIPPAAFSNDLLGFIIPTPLNALGGDYFAGWSALFPGDYSEEGGYFGLPLIALLGVAVYRLRVLPAIRITAVAFCVMAFFSLGPFLTVFGKTIGPAPWVLFYKLPFLKAMLPGRFIMFAWAAAALLIALWLARPAAKPLHLYARYIALACCLAFLLPSRGFDRNWSRLEVPEIFQSADVIRPGSNILILPYAGNEMGYQYAAHMGFHLVGQGYIGGGTPPPFANWRLFPALYNHQFAAINPAEFAAFLAAYGADDVVVLPHDFTQAPAAATLLQAAGWRATTTMQDAIVFTPASAIAPPDAAQIAADSAIDSPPAKEFAAARHREKLIRAETRRVCQINAWAQRLHLNPGRFLVFYVDHVHPPLPVRDIACSK
jgi:hypothetical protein